MIEPARYVPQRIGELTEALAEHPWPAYAEAGSPDRFRSFARLVSALFHFEFHDREQDVVELWDRLSAAEVSDLDAVDRFTSQLTGLLDGANYEPLTMADLEHALENESLLKVNVDVDLADYDELLVYHRGTHLDTVDVQRWRGLRKPVARTMTVDERVVVHTRVKDAAWFAAHDVDPGDRNLVPGDVSLKQFVDVPRADIEMLLPSVQVRFRAADRLAIGVPAIAGGVLVLATKLLPTLGLMFLLFGAWLGLRDEQPQLDQAALVLLATGMFTLGAFVFRQWSKLKNRRIEYWKTLTDNLYFRTLGNGGGVLHELLAAAEEQEVVEVLLGYRFLLDAVGPVTADELDRTVEAFLARHCGGEIDFEVDDALAKLRRLDAARGTDGALTVVPLDEALGSLDQRWDALFRHRRPGGTPVASEPEPEPAPAESVVNLRQVIDRFRNRLGERIITREHE